MLEQAPRPPVRRLPSFLLGALVGFLVGGGVASAVWFFILVGEMYADRLPVGNAHAVIGDNKSIAQDVQTAGDEFVNDLNHKRLLGAYRMTTDDYQTRFGRDDFERRVVQQHPEIFQWPQSGGKEIKVRPKSSDGKQYEYYSTAPHTSLGAVTPVTTKRINISLVLVQQNGAWKVSDLEIDSDPR